ncbi:MAG: bifunctional riboflavin kinase/FAD synthetase [Gammaproteobacteria bacterium]|jgi:riboflavin kinase/FMN adenylyltransferase
MELIRSINSQLLIDQNCVATIGNFDGVHLGHRSVIKQLIRNAKEMGLPSVVVTFEPLPMEFFSATSAPARLTEFREKVELLSAMSVDKVVCLRFNHSLASLSAQSFVKDILVDGLKVKRLIVGDDFRFGANREGNVALLRELGPTYGFDLIPAETYLYENVRVSSSLVRGFLAIGEFERAQHYLGRAYYIEGKVIHGDKRGKKLGFPTANLACHRLNCPLSGVYVVHIHGLNGKIHAGVANMGTRPVFNGEKLLLETFVFDFEQEIYGRRIRIEFVKKLRDELKFHSVEALCEQIEKDVKKARAFLSKA